MEKPPERFFVFRHWFGWIQIEENTRKPVQCVAAKVQSLNGVLKVGASSFSTNQFRLLLAIPSMKAGILIFIFEKGAVSYFVLNFVVNIFISSH
jgi:hypothetical protein